MTMAALRERRRLRPALAFLAGLLSFPLGYRYVGRPRAALPLLGLVVAGCVGFGRSRVLVSRPGFLAFGALLIAASLAGAVHPAGIALRQRHAARQWYNRWWV